MTHFVWGFEILSSNSSEKNKDIINHFDLKIIYKGNDKMDITSMKKKSTESQAQIAKLEKINS